MIVLRGEIWLADLNPVREKVEGIVSENLFYVFVNLNDASAQPTFHVVPSKVVATYSRTRHAEWLSGVGRKGQMRSDSSMRKFSDEDGKYLGAWESLGL